MGWYKRWVDWSLSKQKQSNKELKPKWQVTKTNFKKVTLQEWSSLISAILGTFLIYYFLKPLANFFGIGKYWVWAMIPIFFIAYGIAIHIQGLSNFLQRQYKKGH